MNSKEIPLDLNSLLLCPHCRRWHPVVKGHTEGTDYTLAMLYFVCRGLRYYAGQLGQDSRHPTRNAITPRTNDSVECPGARA